MIRARERTEQGAVAILVAIMAVVLFGMAAFAVDMGNAWARKRDLQTQADLAALAGAAHLSSDSKAEALAAVDEYLGHGCDRANNPSCVPLDPNWVFGQEYDAEWDLDDLNIENGEVQFPADYKMRVITPMARVDFGFAGVLNSADHVKLNAAAAVQVLSPGQVLPFFLMNGPGCSWGSQVLKPGPQTDDETVPGPSPSEIVWDPAGPNNNKIETAEVRPTEWDVTTPGSIEVLGQSRDLPATATVYFNADEGQKAQVANVPVLDYEPISGPGQLAYRWRLSVPLPQVVRDTKAVWAVRVETTANGLGDSNSWESFTVRDPADVPDECGEKSTGDFGILDSPRKTGTPAEAIRDNIAEGLDHPIEIYPGGSDAAPSECTPTSPEVLDDDENLSAGVTPNCLHIETGNMPDAMTDGLIADNTGRLDSDTSQYCQDNEPTPPRVDDDGHSLNGDTLECFLESGSLDAIYSDSYSGDPVLAPEIFESPRFVWVPVLKGDANPKAGFYPLVDFRPVFITDLGFIESGQKVVGISVLAFHPSALPETADSPLAGLPYLGVGTKLLRLVE